MEFEYEIKEIQEQPCRPCVAIPHYEIKVKEPLQCLYCCELLHSHIDKFFIACVSLPVGWMLQSACFYADDDPDECSAIIHYCPFCGEKFSYTTTTKTGEDK